LEPFTQRRKTKSLIILFPPFVPQHCIVGVRLILTRLYVRGHARC
jgi:hypothetical protein